MLKIVKLTDSPVEYCDWENLQERAVEARKAALTADTIYLLEHHPVITIGRSSDASGYLLSSRDELASRGIRVVETDRGGDITYHGPGQLIIYPIIDLQNYGRDLHKYIRGLEQCIIDTIANLKIQGKAIDGLTGVWVDDAKIAAIGIKVSRWVTSHGLSLNNTVDLTPMREDIVPCGLVGKAVTSLAELGIEISSSDLEISIAKSLCRFLNFAAPIEPSTIENEIKILDKLLKESQGAA